MNKESRNETCNAILTHAMIIFILLAVYLILRIMFGLEILGLLAAMILPALYLNRILQKKVKK